MNGSVNIEYFTHYLLLSLTALITGTTTYSISNPCLLWWMLAGSHQMKLTG